MGYNREIYEAVQKKLYNMQTEAREKLAKKKNMLCKRFPVIEDIEKSLAFTSIDAARAVLEGAEASKEIKRLQKKNAELLARLKEILLSVNLPENYLDVCYSCPKCSDEGFVDGIMCSCMKEMLKKESYERLNKMSPLELCSFDNFSLEYYSDACEKECVQSPKKRMMLIFDYCKKYAMDFTKNSPGLLMTGNTGLGKTHLSLSVARDVINKGYGVIYGSAQNMVSKMEREKFRNFREDEESEQHFMQCDLLIIDDLGTEFATAFSNAAIYNIINSRIMMNLPTIISTNLSMRELEKSYTSRMVSRIIGNNIRLEFLGTDIRQIRMRERRN